MAIGKCPLCSKVKLISRSLTVCRECIIERFPEVQPLLNRVHQITREPFSLPTGSLSGEGDINCTFCARECRIPEGNLGYCGIRKRTKKTIKGPHHKEAYVSWYLDPLPTNCVADWFCPGGTGCGYPEFAYTRGPEYGFYNLAVFFESCNLNCLYCQNWHFRYSHSRNTTKSIENLLQSLTSRVSCICFFGGDPSTQTPFAIRFSEEALKNKKGPILRICWETNGLFSPKFLPKVINLSLASGGTIKFDLKAWTKEIFFALTGYDNEKVFQNFAYTAKYIKERKTVPLLTASTLLVPGYVEEEEVYQIARFIASLDPEIPYRLLAFSPQFYMDDLPLLSKEKAYRALEAAKKAGLKRISLGNEQILT